MSAIVSEDRTPTILGPCAADGQTATLMMASVISILREQGVEDDTLRTVLQQIHKKVEKEAKQSGGKSNYKAGYSMGYQSETESLGKRKVSSKLFQDSFPTLEEFEFQTLGCGNEAGRILEKCTTEFIKRNQAKEISEYTKKAILSEIRDKIGSYTSFYDLRNPLKRLKSLVSETSVSSSFAPWLTPLAQSDLIRPFTDMWSRVHTIYCKEQIMTESLCSMVYHASFDQTGQYIIVSVLGGHIKIFKKTGEVVKTLIGHSKEINILTLCQNNKYLVSADEDGVIRVWEFPSGKPVAVLTEHQGQEIATLNMHEESRLVDLNPEASPVAKFQNTPTQLAREVPWKSFLLTASSTKGLIIYSEDQFKSNQGRKNEQQRSIHYIARGDDNKPLGFLTAEINSQSGEIAAYATTFRIYIWPRLRDTLSRYTESELCKKDLFLEIPPLQVVYTVDNQNLGNIIVLWSADGKYLVSSNEEQTKLVRFFSNQKPQTSKKSSMLPTTSCETLAEISSGLNSKAKKKQWIEIIQSAYTAINEKFLVTSFNINQKKLRSEDEDRLGNCETELVVYELESGKITYRINPLVTGVNMRTNTSSLVQSPTIPSLAITTDMEGQVIFWDCALGVALRIFLERATHLEKPLSTNAPTDCNFSQDGCYLAVSTSLGSYSIYGYGGSQWFEHVDNQQFVSHDWANFYVDPLQFHLMKSNGTLWKWWEDKQVKMNIFQNPVNQCLRDSLTKALDFYGNTTDEKCKTPTKIDQSQLTLHEGRQILDFLATTNQIRLKDYKMADEADQKTQEEIIQAEQERFTPNLEGIHERIKARLEYEAEQEQERLKQATQEAAQNLRSKLSKKASKHKNTLFEGSDDDSQSSGRHTVEVSGSGLAGALGLNRGDTTSTSAGRLSGEKSDGKVEGAEAIAETLVASMARNLGVAGEVEPASKKSKHKKNSSKPGKSGASEPPVSSSEPASKCLQKLGKSSTPTADVKGGSSSSSRKKKKGNKDKDKEEEKVDDEARAGGVVTDSMECSRCAKPVASERCSGTGCRGVYHYECLQLAAVERGEQNKMCYGCYIQLSSKNSSKTLLSSLSLEWIQQSEKDYAKLYPQIGDEFYFIAQPYEEFVAGFFEILGFNSIADVFPWADHPSLKLKDTKVVVESTKLEWPSVKEHQVMLKFQKDLHVIMNMRVRVVPQGSEQEKEEIILKLKYLPIGKMRNRFLIWAQTYETKLKQYKAYDLNKQIKTDEGVHYKILEKDIFDEVFGESYFNCMRAASVDAIVGSGNKKTQDVQYFSPWELEFVEAESVEDPIDLSEPDQKRETKVITLDELPNAPKSSPVQSRDCTHSSSAEDQGTKRKKSKWPVNLQPWFTAFLCLPEWKVLLPADTNPKVTQLTAARPHTPTASTPVTIRDRLASGFYRTAEQLGMELVVLGLGAVAKDKDKPRKSKVKEAMNKVLAILLPDESVRADVTLLGKHAVGLADPYNDTFSMDTIVVGASSSPEKSTKTKNKGPGQPKDEKKEEKKQTPRTSLVKDDADQGENLFGEGTRKNEREESPEEELSEGSEEIDIRMRMDPDGDDLVDDESSEGERIVDRVAKNATAASKFVEDKPVRREGVHTLINEEEWDTTMRLGSGYERGRRNSSNTPYSGYNGIKTVHSNSRLGRQQGQFFGYQNDFIAPVSSSRPNSGYIRVDDHYNSDLLINVDQPFAPGYPGFGVTSTFRPVSSNSRNSYHTPNQYPNFQEQNLLQSQYYTRPVQATQGVKPSIKDTREK